MLLVSSIAEIPDLHQCNRGLVLFMAAAPNCTHLHLACALERVHADAEEPIVVKNNCDGQVEVLELQFSGNSEAVSFQLANPARLRSLHTLVLAGIARFNLTVLTNLNALENLALHFCLDISPLKELHTLRCYSESPLVAAAAAALIVMFLCRLRHHHSHSHSAQPYGQPTARTLQHASTCPG